jgi:hypothetical protein
MFVENLRKSKSMASFPDLTFRANEEHLMRRKAKKEKRKEGKFGISNKATFCFI